MTHRKCQPVPTKACNEAKETKNENAHVFGTLEDYFNASSTYKPEQMKQVNDHLPANMLPSSAMAMERPEMEEEVNEDSDAKATEGTSAADEKDTAGVEKQEEKDDDVDPSLISASRVSTASAACDEYKDDLDAFETEGEPDDVAGMTLSDYLHAHDQDSILNISVPLQTTPAEQKDSKTSTNEQKATSKPLPSKELVSGMTLEDYLGASSVQKAEHPTVNDMSSRKQPLKVNDSSHEHPPMSKLLQGHPDGMHTHRKARWKPRQPKVQSTEVMTKRSVGKSVLPTKASPTKKMNATSAYHVKKGAFDASAPLPKLHQGGGKQMHLTHPSQEDVATKRLPRLS